MQEKGKRKGFYKYPLGDYILEQLKNIKFIKPTTVQEQVIPQIFNKKNLIVEAATGTGKTAAYGLPFLSKVNPQKNNPQVLVLVPSRELAIQVEAALKSFTSDPRIKILALYGGAPIKDAATKIKSHGQVVVAVPGRLRDVLSSGNFDWFWRDISYLVIDEADKLLEAGFQSELDHLLRNIKKSAQVTLFSATISSDAEMLIRERFSPIKSIRLSPQEAFQNIKFFGVPVVEGQNAPFLGGLLKAKKIKKALIFCSKRAQVHSVANFLRSIGRKAQAYHGLLDQTERKAILQRFQNHQIEFLVATDLAARGLDVESLPAVINYAFPQDIEVYQHRAGRTGRAGKKGACYNLITSDEESIYMDAFHQQWQVGYTSITIRPMAKGSKKLEKLVKVHINRGKKDKVSAGDIVGFILNNTSLTSDEIGTIAVYEDHIIVDLPASLLQGLEDPEAKYKIKGKTVKIRKYGLAEREAKAKKVKKRVISQRERKRRGGKGG